MRSPATAARVRPRPKRPLAFCQTSLLERLESRTLFAGGLDPSLTAWFQADAIVAAPATLVATWADSSGMGFNATQPNVSQRPTYLTGAINGHAAVHFSAAASTQLAFTRPVSGDFTIVVVFRSAQGLAHDLAWFDGAGLVDGEVTGVANDFGLSLNAFGQVLGGTGN